jgi:hypothetical protein
MTHDGQRNMLASESFLRRVRAILFKKGSSNKLDDLPRTSLAKMATDINSTGQGNKIQRGSLARRVSRWV